MTGACEAFARVVRRVATAAAALTLLAGCTSPATAGRIPTRAEAVALLDQAVRLATARDFAGLCRLGGGNCADALDVADRDAVPRDAPAIAEDFELPPAALPGGATDVGGRVLVVCGIDGRARPYRTEMLVFFDGRDIKAIEPVYWSGMTVGRSAQPGTATPPPGRSPPIRCP